MTTVRRLQTVVESDGGTAFDRKIHFRGLDVRVEERHRVRRDDALEDDRDARGSR